jgi:diguanylate cyclase (GGDEF)-like protein
MVVVMSGRDGDPGGASKRAPTTIGVTRRAEADPKEPRLALMVLTGGSEGELFVFAERPVFTLGREDVDAVVVDPEISRRHAAVRREAGTGRFYLMDLDSRNGTFVNGKRVDEDVEIREGDLLELGATTKLRVVDAFEPEVALVSRMKSSTMRDPLTGCYNRRYLEERLRAEEAFSRRHRTPLTAAMLDVDDFKRINDTFGHAAGDRVLVGVAETIRRTIRVEDIVVRYGGDELLVLCRGIHPDEGAIAGERIRRAIEIASLLDAPVTVSIGVAGLAASVSDGAGLVAAADEALYAAKAGGRNTVVIHPGFR